MNRLENGAFILREDEMREIELYVYLAVQKLEEENINLLLDKAILMARNIDKTIRK